MSGQAFDGEEVAQRRAARGYHHGDVPAAAVAAALAHLHQHGQPDFTLRSIAQDLAISHPSLYNHFRSRDALIDAVAVVGFRDLAAQIEELVGASPDTLTTIRAVGHRVVDFARTQPGLYRLMFGADLMHRKADDARLASAMEAPLRLVAGLVQRSSDEGRLRAKDPLLTAAGMWATAHGLAMLVIDGRLDVLGADREGALVASTVDAMLAGFAAPVTGTAPA